MDMLVGPPMNPNVGVPVVGIPRLDGVTPRLDPNVLEEDDVDTSLDDLDYMDSVIERRKSKR